MVESKWFPESALADGTLSNYGRTCRACGEWKSATEHRQQRIPTKARVYLGTVCKPCAYVPKPQPRTCANPECGRIFTPQLDVGMYCKKACGSVAWRQRNEAAGLKLCPRCECWLPVDSFHVRDSEPVHTCKTCRTRHGLAERECQNPDCDQSFLPDRKTDRYCNRKCAGTASRRKNGHRRRVAPDGIKTCTRCKKAKPVGEFSRDRSRYVSRCKRCSSELANERNKAKVRDRLGLPVDAFVRRGPTPPGATYTTGQGYVYEKRPGHPRANGRGYVLQHILVAEEKYQMSIGLDFTVDHLNDDRSDNRPENLALRSGQHGRFGEAMPTVLRHADERTRAITVLFDHPGYRAEIFAEAARRGYVVLRPYEATNQATT